MQSEFPRHLPELSTFGANAEFVAALAVAGVRVLVIGGVAIRYYVPTRDADDLEIMIEPSEEAAGALMAELPRWNEPPGFAADAISTPGNLPRHLPLKKFLHLDLIVPAASFSFEAEWMRAQPATLNQRQVKIAAPELLIEMKKGSTRDKDIQDVVTLRSYLAGAGSL